MLKTLENKDVRDAEYLLASVAQRLLPQPGISSPEQEVGESEEVRLLQEIQADLRLDPADQSPGAKTKLLEFLYNEMSKPLISGPRHEQARARLEQKGYLLPATYHITFGDSFRENEEKRGIRRSHVEEALRSPDHEQHLPPATFRRQDFAAMSIYTKMHEGRALREKFTLLIISRREGHTQHIANAWRVYHAEVPISPMDEPLRVLRAFVDVYGVPFRVGNSAPAKFFLYEAFLVAPSQLPTNVIAIENYPAQFYSAHFIRISSVHVVEVSLAYTIDLSRYLADLRQHNVHISS